MQRQRPRYLTRKLLTMLQPLFETVCVMCVRACVCEHVCVHEHILLLLVCIAAAAVVNNKFPLGEAAADLQQKKPTAAGEGMKKVAAKGWKERRREGVEG